MSVSAPIESSLPHGRGLLRWRRPAARVTTPWRTGYRDGVLYLLGESQAFRVRFWPQPRLEEADTEGKWQACDGTSDFIFHGPLEQLDHLRAPCGLTRTAGGSWCEDDTQLLIPETLPLGAIIAHLTTEHLELAYLTMPKSVSLAVLVEAKDGRWRLLQFAAQCREAEELVQTNLGLGYLLANSDQLAVGCTAVDTSRLARGRQRDALGLLGFPATEAMRRIIGRLRIDELRRGRLIALRQTLGDSDVQHLLTHAESIDEMLLCLCRDGWSRKLLTPQLVQHFGRACPSQDEDFDSNEIFYAFRLLRLAADQELWTPQTISSLDQLRRLVERLSRLHSNGRLSFPPPPFPGDDNLQPLSTQEMLAVEAQDQSNCLLRLSCAVSVMEGAIYFYRMLHPVRATLSVLRTEKGRWELGQLLLADNQEPPPFLRKVVNGQLGLLDLAQT
jgi:hypothetical protein